MSLFHQVPIDILFSINGFLNPIDKFYLKRVCQRFYSYFKEDEKPTIETLIEYGYLDLLLQFNLLKTPKIKWINIAVEYGQLEIVKYFAFFVTPDQEKQNGKLSLVGWPIKDLCLFDEWTCSYAAENGHLKVLQWLKQNGCPWDERTCCRAALGGYLDILQWARENGCPWNASICSNAAFRGHLKTLQWARSQYTSPAGWIKDPCPWNESTCSFAAENGHLHVLQWARSQGCPWSREQCLKFSTDPKIIEWINQN